jgi:uncharacterized cupin superfamily protein
MYSWKFKENDMLRTGLGVAALLIVLAFLTHGFAGDAVQPEKMSKADIAGNIFERQDMIELTKDGNTTLDVTTFLSSDNKFGSGVYKSGAVRFEIDDPYGVDEFMYFIEGGVTLTSADGTVHVISAGDGVTIPKEWTGVWETDGYTKIWVIYSEDGSGL